MEEVQKSVGWTFVGLGWYHGVLEHFPKVFFCLSSPLLGGEVLEGRAKTIVWTIDLISLMYDMGKHVLLLTLNS